MIGVNDVTNPDGPKHVLKVTVFTLGDHPDLMQAPRFPHESNRVAAAHCRGVAALTEVRLADGSYLIDGKRWSGAPTTSTAVALIRSPAATAGWITGQQPYSGAETARVVIAALGT